MKPRAYFLALTLLAGSGLGAVELVPGNSRADVRAALGVPRGQVTWGDRQILYFQRGEVELQVDRVTRVALRSPEEHAVWVAEEESKQGEREARRVVQVTEGTALRDGKLADESFRAAPVAYQLAFWQDFVRRYPEVSCVEPLTIARLRLNEQIEEKRQREEQMNRLAAIEERIAAAERRPEFYPLYTTSRYHGWRGYHPFSLGPITYTFFNKPLPPYTTPSGNPAGNLTGSLVGLPNGNPAVPEHYEPYRQRGNRGDHHNRSDRGNSGRM